MSTESNKILVSKIGYAHYDRTGEVENHVTTLSDVSNGCLINFKFYYEWIDPSNCKISDMSWQPMRMNESGELVETSFQDIGFTRNGHIEIKINSEIINIPEDSNKLNGNHNLFNTDDDYYIIQNVDKNWFIVSFSYSYTGTSSGIGYIINIQNIKVPKPNRYENNIVFNKDGLNELIGYFKNYPLIAANESSKFGNISITKGTSTTVNVPIKGFDTSTSNNLLVSTHLLPDVDNQYDLGNITDPKRWRNLYLKGNIGNESNPIGNIYGKNGFFSTNLTAKNLLASEAITAPRFNGLLTGTGININDKFLVSAEGNVTMNGNVVWGDTSNPIQVVYHNGDESSQSNPSGIPAKPSDSTNVFESYSSTNWHTDYNSENDFWMSVSYNNSQTWNTPVRINARDGAWDQDSIITALNAIDEDGIYNFSDVTNEEGQVVKQKIGLKATAIQALLAQFNEIEMASPASEGAELSGGFISFDIKNPFRFSPGGMNKMKARIGYIWGNGDGNNNNTTGIAFVIHTAANYPTIIANDNYISFHKDPSGDNPNDFGAFISQGINDRSKKTWIPSGTNNNNIFVEDGSSPDDKYLVLSILMFTSGGLGLLTANIPKSTSSNGTSQKNLQRQWAYTNNFTACYELDTTTGEPKKEDNGKLKNPLVEAIDPPAPSHYYYRWWTGNSQSNNLNNGKGDRLWIDKNNGKLYHLVDENRYYEYENGNPKQDANGNPIRKQAKFIQWSNWG